MNTAVWSGLLSHMFLLHLQARLQHAWDLGRGGWPECWKSATLHCHVEGFSSSLLHSLSQQHLQSPSSSQNSERYEITAVSPLNLLFSCLWYSCMYTMIIFVKVRCVFLEPCTLVSVCFDKLYEVFEPWWVDQYWITSFHLKEQFTQIWFSWKCTQSKMQMSLFLHQNRSVQTYFISGGTHSLQRIHWWASDVMLNFSKSVLKKKQTHLHLGCLRVNFNHMYKFFNYSFNHLLKHNDNVFY